MPMMMPAGSMPVISYWIWGFIGLLILWWSFKTIRYKRPDNTYTYFWENLAGVFIGLFLIYYWLNKIGIVPMYFWQLDNWFYGWH